MNTAAAQTQLMDQSLESIRQTADGLEDKTARLWGAIETLKNAILGLRISLHQEIERAVDAYFDLEQSRIVRDTLEAVEQYPVQFEGKEDLIDTRWLFQQFHHVLS